MTEPLNPAYVAWCRETFTRLHDGGAWGIPRSGLIFRKRRDAFVLEDRMPWVPDMPITCEQLVEQQQHEFEQTKLHFEAADIPVRDATSLFPEDV